jgi:hypothetical protein
MGMEHERQPEPYIEVEEVSENIRVYSTGDVKDEFASDVVLGITSHPSVDSARAITGGPLLRIEVIASSPEKWQLYIDPHCREIILSATKF